jgi:hypothetical protein
MQVCGLSVNHSGRPCSVSAAIIASSERISGFDPVAPSVASAPPAQPVVLGSGIMYKVRESWTDERLDDFVKHVDHRFDAVDHRFDAVDQRFDRVEADLRDLRSDLKSESKALRTEMQAGFEAMQKEMHHGFEAMRHQMLQFSVAIIVALIGLIATQL